MKILCSDSTVVKDTVVLNMVTYLINRKYKKYQYFEYSFGYKVSLIYLAFEF